jgi:hypothetical protein
VPSASHPQASRGHAHVRQLLGQFSLLAYLLAPDA